MTLATAATIATLAVPRGLAQLAYLRPAVERGELHRLLTAHLVHARESHLALDLAALALAFALVGRERSSRHWTILLFVSAVSSSLAVHWFSPSTAAFAGLSALVHAVLSGGAAALLRRRAAAGAWLAAGLAAKFALERLHGPFALALAGSPAVATDAHLYASLAGAACGWWLSRRAASHATASAATASRPSAAGPTPASSRPSSANAPASAESEL